MVGHIKLRPHPPAPPCPGNLACAGRLKLVKEGHSFISTHESTPIKSFEIHFT